MYAFIKTGGRQYRVEVGDVIQVEKMPQETGQQVELEQVLLVGGGEAPVVGRPLVTGAKVLATGLEHVQGQKVRVFKYIPKERYRRTKGHRQQYTRLRIDEIVV